MPFIYLPTFLVHNYTTLAHETRENSGAARRVVSLPGHAQTVSSKSLVSLYAKTMAFLLSVFLIYFGSKDNLFSLSGFNNFTPAGTGAQVQVVPQGIDSVNGSSVNMGCTSSLVDSGGMMVCES